MNSHKFTRRQRRAIPRMKSFIMNDYGNHDVEFRKSTLLDWIKFLFKMETRKTYSDANQKKLNEIRDYIMTSKLFR